MAYLNVVYGRPTLLVAVIAVLNGGGGRVEGAGHWA